MEKENMLKANISTEDSEIKKKILCIVKGCTLSIVLSIILLTIYALLLVNTTVSESTMMPVVLTITGVSILIGGTVSARKLRKNGLIYGGIVGLVYVITLYLASSISMVGFSLSINSFIMLAVGGIAGIIGGIIGVNLSAKK
ncbi:MAG: TIGR04086 family membrane protein [Clostridia bacterium]|nr:TIGR04086 family membrane protein [Clostridia bacterium]